MTDRTTPPRAHHFTVYASRADWLADRSASAPDGGPSIGASDVASIFGCGFRGPAETAAIMRGIAPKEPESADPMNPLNVGNRLECTALAEYELIHNGAEYAPEVWDEITRWTHPEAPWLSVSPDAILCGPPSADPDGPPFATSYGAAVGLVEVKIPRGAWALAEYAPDLGDEPGAGYGIAATLADTAAAAMSTSEESLTAIGRRLLT